MGATLDKAEGQNSKSKLNKSSTSSKKSIKQTQSDYDRFVEYSKKRAAAFHAGEITGFLSEEDVETDLHIVYKSQSHDEESEIKKSSVRLTLSSSILPRLSTASEQFT